MARITQDERLAIRRRFVSECGEDCKRVPSSFMRELERDYPHISRQVLRKTMRTRFDFD